MTTSELISLMASLASLILAVIAIWLSIVFYRMSSAIGDDIKDASKGISANVERLEKLFDRLYSDTFSMVKDTVTDMRKHMWPEEVKSEIVVSHETEKKADVAIDKLRHEMNVELEKILDRQTGTDQKLHSLASDVTQLVDRAISKTREAEVEAREQTLRESIMKVLKGSKRKRKGLDAFDLLEALRSQGDHVNVTEMVEELAKMRSEELVEYEQDAIMPSTVITLPGK